MKFYCTNTVNGLVPNTDMDYEQKRKLKLGQVYRVEVKKPRNYRFHKKFFALLNLVWENMPEELNKAFGRFENFRYTVTMQAGFYEKFINHKGNEQFRPISISFAKMDEVEFESLYSGVIDIVLRDYLPGMERADLENEVLAFT